MWFLPVIFLISQESVYLLFVCVNCNAKCTPPRSERVIQNHIVIFCKEDRERRQNCLKLPGLEIIQGMKFNCHYLPRKLKGSVILTNRQDLCSVLLAEDEEWSSGVPVLLKVLLKI